MFSFVHRATSEPIRLRRSAFVEAVLIGIPALDFTPPIARIHAQLQADLTNKGKLIGAHDLIIGATAVSHGYALLTGNVGEFARIAGLQLLPL